MGRISWAQHPPHNVCGKVRQSQHHSFVSSFILSYIQDAVSSSVLHSDPPPELPREIQGGRVAIMRISTAVLDSARSFKAESVYISRTCRCVKQKQASSTLTWCMWPEPEFSQGRWVRKLKRILESTTYTSPMAANIITTPI